MSCKTALSILVHILNDAAQCDPDVSYISVRLCDLIDIRNAIQANDYHQAGVYIVRDSDTINIQGVSLPPEKWLALARGEKELPTSQPPDDRERRIRALAERWLSNEESHWRRRQTPNVKPMLIYKNRRRNAGDEIKSWAKRVWSQATAYIDALDACSVEPKPQLRKPQPSALTCNHAWADVCLHCGAFK